MTTNYPEQQPAELDDRIERGTYVYLLEQKGERSYVFRQVDENVPEGEPARHVGYEVFLRKVQKPKVARLGDREVNLEHKIKFPPNTAFGVWAWAYTNLEPAMAKFAELEGKVEVVKA